MKVYVAGASAEVREIAGHIAVLREAGIEITHDWTKEVLEARKRGWTDDLLDVSARQRAAEEDRAGVLAASWVWLVAPSEPSRGCWVEFGLALGERVPVVVSGDWRRTIFTELANVTFTRHEDAIGFLIDEARG